VNNIVTFENLTSPGTPTATTYHWDFGNNGDTSDLEDPTYNGYPLTGGVYTVCLTATNAVGSSNPYCTDVELDDLTVGVNEIGMGGFVLAPNPAIDLVQITAPEGRSIQGHRIIAVDGSLVQAESTTISSGVQLDVSSLLKGIYFVELKTDQDDANRLPLVIQ
jgi:PKD repeat protein